MTTNVRTRFAPSPTGPLHLGNARTAILNWLFARRHGGAFILRLEDTDVERNVPGAEEAIGDALDWLGLDRDEGPESGGPTGPYRQSERGALYTARAATLLERGEAFRCYCTADELEAHRIEAIAAGRSPGRDPRCRALDDATSRALERAGRRAAIRLRVDSGPIAFEDRLKGALSIDGDDLGDMVLLREDGRATYNFAVAVDDIEMRISHVIRGIGHLSNTPKQVLLYRALGVAPPQFVHIPNVLASGGGKLSKREGAPGVLDYRDRGFHPEAVVNYLSLLSWSAASGEEVLSREQLVASVDLDRVGATDSEIDEEKLAWLSGQHLRAEPPERLARRWADTSDWSELGLKDDDLVRAAEVFAKRTQLLTEARAELEAVFAPPRLEAAEVRRALGAPEAVRALAAVAETWREGEWRPGPLKEALRAASGRAGVSGRAFFHPVRVALTGAAEGPDLGEVAFALGRERALSRLAEAAERARGTAEGGKDR